MAYAIIQNHNWELILNSNTQNIVGCKWIFKIKCKLDWSIKCNKAQVIANGFCQHLSIDFHGMFNLVVKPKIICLILTCIVQFG